MSRRSLVNGALRFGITLALVSAFTGRADVFRSVDDTGTPEFSAHKPAGTQPAEKIKLEVPKAPEQPAADAPIVHQGTGGIKLEVKPETKPKPTKEQRAKMKALCAQAKASEAQLSGESGARTNRLQYIDKNGERAFLTEEQVQQRLTEMRQKIKDYCVQ